MKKNNKEQTGSRFVKGRKQEALAEIEAWVGGSREKIIKAGAAKVASHPAKNITEQKMLDAHLYEMSKQRFHFVVQCQWESRLFLQKQKRKTAVMRDLLRNVDSSFLSENPFSAQKRVPKSEQSKKSRKSDRLYSSKSSPFEEGKSKFSGPGTFITENVLNISSKKHSDAFPALELNKKKRETRDWMWPVHDDRYVKLSEVLCDTYPKIAPLQAKRKHLNPLTVNAGV